MNNYDLRFSAFLNISSRSYINHPFPINLTFSSSVFAAKKVVASAPFKHFLNKSTYMLTSSFDFASIYCFKAIN